MSDLEFDLSRSPKVKSNGAVRHPLYDFLLVCNNNRMSISHRLAVVATGNFSPISYHWAKIFAPPPLALGRFFSKSNNLIPGSEGRYPPKIQLLASIVFELGC